MGSIGAWLTGAPPAETDLARFHFAGGYFFFGKAPSIFPATTDAS